MLRHRLILFALVCFGAEASWAQTKLPAFFTDHMVLQREAPHVVWGWDQPGTKVTVKIGDQSADTIANGEGEWVARIPPLKVGGPYELAVHGSTDHTFQDVLVGDVWLCSGQSNMEWTVGQSNNAEAEIAAANYPKIRHLKVAHTPAAEPQADLTTNGWQVCSPETVGSFTAVGYFFGRELASQLDVPIGLIGSNWGGTRIEPWIPPQGFKQQHAALADIADHLSDFPARNDKGEINHQTPLALYNGMIHPLIRWPMRGATWYQGESNNGEGMLYNAKMKALIGGWRLVWNQPEMPFYFVQLAPFRYGNPEGLPEIWYAQFKTLEVEHTGMAVITDIGNVQDIHPRNKQDVGHRLALWALANTYGKKEMEYSGPLFHAASVDGNKVRLEFTHAGGGLATRDGKPPSDFTIAGKDGQFVPATAEINGNSIVCWSTTVAQPVQVRFAWNQEANPNLTNKEGLPASPFRWELE